MRTGRGKTESRPAVAGFSLIEVTISIAITAVALVALMGMLPAGMKTMREATDRAVETRIHQQILGEVMLADWDDQTRLQNLFHDKIRYYDDQGIELEAGMDDFDFSHVYTARIQIPNQALVMPGADASKANLQLVIVEITSLNEPSFKNGSGFDNENFSESIRTFQGTVAKTGNNF